MQKLRVVTKYLHLVGRDSLGAPQLAKGPTLSQTWPTCGTLHQSKDLCFEVATNQRFGTVEFKVVRESSGYCVQCTFPI